MKDIFTIQAGCPLELALFCKWNALDAEEFSCWAVPLYYGCRMHPCNGLDVRAEHQVEDSITKSLEFHKNLSNQIKNIIGACNERRHG
eukprot:324768-Ditylum_brightwellii.AAC.1